VDLKVKKKPNPNPNLLRRCYGLIFGVCYLSTGTKRIDCHLLYAATHFSLNNVVKDNFLFILALKCAE